MGAAAEALFGKKVNRLSAMRYASEEMDQIKLDLINLFRPNASPAMGAAFAEWADAWQDFHAVNSEGDEELTRRGDIMRAAQEQLMALPCTTSGDFIVKACIELISETGALCSEAGDLASAFMPNMRDEHTARSGVCYLLPVPALQRAWRHHGREWLRLYGTRRAYNEGWVTVGVPVPKGVLLQAIAEAMVVSWRIADGRLHLAGSGPSAFETSI